jgi:ribosome biogenesis GTPase
MSKRRVNQQQSARILKIQKEYLQKEDVNSLKGLILTRFSRHAEIEDEKGKRIHCSLRPNIDSLVAGDKVMWQPLNKDQGVVVSRFPRHSLLGRHDKKGNFRAVAANITQIMIVVAPKPEISWPLLDSYLVMAESLQLQTCIVLNKTDLPCESIRQELLDIYAPLGYPILLMSQKFTQPYQKLQTALAQHTSVFVGQSGVGKSSLIAALLPEENISTSLISPVSELGRHTTSNSRFYHLPLGGALIDSPGVREIGLWHMPLSEIALAYPEFRPLVKQCKFRNCNHQDSPGCAITIALREGKITQRRYENFCKMVKQFIN